MKKLCIVASVLCLLILVNVPLHTEDGQTKSILQRVAALEEENIALKKQIDSLQEKFTLEPWQPVTLESGWCNSNSVHTPGNIPSPAGYYKDAFGIVHLRGLIENGKLEQKVFQLPSGYRPAYGQVFIVFGHTKRGDEMVSPVRVDVTVTGDVFIHPIQGSSDNTKDSFVSLDGITFRAEK